MQTASTALSQAQVQLSTAFIDVVAGGAAGVVAWASIYPLEIVKSRTQASGRPALTEWRQLRAQGRHVMWRGMPATLIRAFAVNAAIFYGVGSARRALASNTPC